MKFHNGEVFDAEIVKLNWEENLKWLIEEPALRRLYDQVLRTLDPEQQQELIRQMERHIHEHAYVLFLYNPIQLYAANKAVEFVPYATFLSVAEAGVTDQHWSVRQAAMKQE